ncbi:MAG: hypothetical protein LUH07_13900 [Lachnospiraceae bacterium]|nr:hypothetical protein [Lachnospiraceae bacterium]
MKDKLSTDIRHFWFWNRDMEEVTYRMEFAQDFVKAKEMFRFLSVT